VFDYKLSSIFNTHLYINHLKLSIKFLFHVSHFTSCFLLPTSHVLSCHKITTPTNQASPPQLSYVPPLLSPLLLFLLSPFSFSPLLLFLLSFSPFSHILFLLFLLFPLSSPLSFQLLPFTFIALCFKNDGTEDIRKLIGFFDEPCNLLTIYFLCLFNQAQPILHFIG